MQTHGRTKQLSLEMEGMKNDLVERINDKGLENIVDTRNSPDNSRTLNSSVSKCV
jgi:hypothetical protein